MSDTSAALLAQLETLQARFLDAVHSGDWPRAETLETARSSVIDLLLGESRSAEITDALRTLAVADRKLVPHVEAALTETAGQLADLRRGRTAARAYAAGTGHP